jgi:membrane-bound acyltransferase YfiQ involved in biofilm formation
MTPVIANAVEFDSTIRSFSYKYASFLSELIIYLINIRLNHLIASGMMTRKGFSRYFANTRTQIALSLTMENCYFKWLFLANLPTLFNRLSAASK